MEDKYPNLVMLTRGCVSGNIREWPGVKAEAKLILDELTSAHAEIAELKADREILFHAMRCPFDHCERCIADANRVRQIRQAIDAARTAEGK